VRSGGGDGLERVRLALAQTTASESDESDAALLMKQIYRGARAAAQTDNVGRAPLPGLQGLQTSAVNAGFFLCRRRGSPA